jgi:hypothetical protein
MPPGRSRDPARERGRCERRPGDEQHERPELSRRRGAQHVEAGTDVSKQGVSRGSPSRRSIRDLCALPRGRRYAAPPHRRQQLRTLRCEVHPHRCDGATSSELETKPCAGSARRVAVGLAHVPGVLSFAEDASSVRPHTLRLARSRRQPPPRGASRHAMTTSVSRDRRRHKRDVGELFQEAGVAVETRQGTATPDLQPLEIRR